MQKSYLAIETDTHGGHRQGLLNPNTVIEEEDEEGNIYEFEPELSATQKYLWKLRTDAITALKKKAGSNRIDYLHVGDQTQGKKYMSELVSSMLSAQITIAAENMAPILGLENLECARFAKGTPSHGFGEGSTGNILQRVFVSEYPGKNIKTFWHGLLTINGVTIDVSHHGPFPGSRNWLKGNVARYYLRDRMYSDLMAGKEPPALYVRGHYHEEVWETVRMKNNGSWHESTLIVVPSMCGMGCYARQSTRSANRVSNGLVVVGLDDGQILGIDWFTQSKDIRTKEVL